MNVLETKQVVRGWVEANAASWPGLRAAHLVGGITAMDDADAFPSTKDVDMHLIFENDSPMVQPRGPMPNMMEVSVQGVPIEVGLKPVSEYATPEAILGNPELAFHFTVASSLYDPDGWLDGLCRAVTSEYADREWVDARMEHERSGLERAFGLRPLAQQWLGPSGELSMLGYASTFLAGAFSVAALQPPKIGARLFVTIRAYLIQQNRMDLHERMLAIFGLDRVTAPDVQQMLNEATRFFDLALERKQHPHPFEHKLHAHLRPYLVDSCRRMIEEGLHREAAGWILPYYLATTDILKVDGLSHEQEWADGRQYSFLNDRRFATPGQRNARFAEMAQLAEEIFALCEDMIVRNPAIQPPVLARAA
jgi:hypothetical protein